MQELEKILEEIDDCICDWLSTPTDEFDEGYIKGLRRAKRIIYARTQKIQKKKRRKEKKNQKANRKEGAE